MSEIFTGAVSAQSAAGETVTITITRVADNNVASLQAGTADDGSYTSTYTDQPGDYSAVAHIDKDDKFTAADSDAFLFTLATGLTTRTITLTGTAA